MSYEVQETSVRSASKVSLFEFTVGNQAPFRYTNAEQDVPFNSFNYVSQTLSYDEPRRTFDKDADQLDIEIQGDNPIPALYTSIVPAVGVQVRIIEFHRTDLAMEAAVFFTGRISSVSHRESGMSRMLVLSDVAGFSRELPRDKYRGPCNNQLGDDRCGVNLLALTSTLAVTNVVGNVYTIDSLDTAGPTADYFLGGIIRASGGLDERTIYAVSGNQTTVLLPFPTDQVAVGSQVQVEPGCDHALTGDCLNKHANTDNFGGFWYVPGRNPWETGLL